MRRCLWIALFLLLGRLISDAQFKNFITTQGDKLMDGEKELRFISCNIPNLHYIEDYLPFDGTNPWRLPDEFEIRDALTAIKQMGGKVVRIYVFSVRKETDTTALSYVEGPGKFNEEAFRAFDKVLQVADEVGIRIIVPFGDNWFWWGGPKEYAGFSGKSRNAFWTDPQVIADFEKTISFVLKRTNTFTGVPYSEEKAILAWETGNEIEGPFSWTKEIAHFVKSIDKNHLVMEGTLRRDVTEEALDDPDLDIMSTHYYHDAKAAVEYIVKNRALTRGKKPFIVGEFGIVPTEDIRMIADTVINQGVSGAMIWSLRFRSRDGGFYHHYEYDNFEAYRWPGFPSGDFYDERGVLQLLREKAHEIDGTPVDRLPTPAAPSLLPINDVSAISWQGSTGAESYVVERLRAGDTAWTVVGNAVDDSRYQYRPLFSDTSAQIGMEYSYRVSAKNETGISGYSKIVGPVGVRSKVVVDEMENFDFIYQKDGALRLLTTEDLRRAKEDRSRLAGDEGSYVVYKLSGRGEEITVDYFVSDTARHATISTSSDLGGFAPLPATKRVFSFGSNEYGYFTSVALDGTAIPEKAQFVKIDLEPGIQISRIEIRTR